MVQKDHRKPQRIDQEWLDLIQECRASGISDKDWCDLQFGEEKHYICMAAIYAAYTEECILNVIPLLRDTGGIQRTISWQKSIRNLVMRTSMLLVLMR